MNEPIPHNEWTLRPEYADAVLDVLGRRWPAQGVEVAALEAELADRFRPDGHCAVVSSGTAALYLALRLEARWQISVPTYACSAIYNAAREACIDEGGGPSVVPVDCDETTFNAPTADVFVHTYGWPSEVPDNSVEDFTHAPGAMLNDKPCGSFGALSVVSFGATKPLGVGMGGAVLGPMGAIAEIRALRDYDASNRMDGFNFQLGDIYAAMVRARLRRLSEDNAWRLEVAQRYDEAHRHAFKRIGPLGTFYRYTLMTPARFGAQEWFDTRGICTINPLRPDELLHRRLGYGPDPYPRAELYAARTLSLPIWPGMTEAQVGRVVEALAEFPA